MPGQVSPFPLAGQVSTHFSVNCSPNAISPKREPGVEASLPRTLLGKRSCAHPKYKKTSVLRCSSPHPPTSLPCRKLWRLLPPLQCMGMVTTQSSHAQCGVPNFPIVRERPLLLILRLKLPGNVACTYTAHARTRWRHCLLTQALPKHQAARSSSQKSAKRAMFQCNAQCNTT